MNSSTVVVAKMAAMGPGDEKLVGDSSRAVLWIGFLCMFLSTIYFMANTMRNQVKKKAIFYYVTTCITLIASFAYLLMALGGSIIIVQDGRQFLWARYADWLVTTPLLLLDLCLLAGISLPEILFLIVCDVLMVLAGFAGVVTTNPIAVWPMLIFGCICLGPIVWFLGSGLTSRATNPDVAKQFKTLSWLTIVLWSAYPLVWALGEGAHWITVDAETILYAILDVTAKCVFGFILLGQHSSLVAAKGLVSDEKEATKDTAGLVGASTASSGSVDDSPVRVAAPAPSASGW